MQFHSSEMERAKGHDPDNRRIRHRRPPADNRPSIGFALHNRFPQDEQPSLAAFAQVMAHRIRGLLTGIEGFTDLLLESIETTDQRELALRVLESTSRIEGILSDLQHFNDPLEAHFHRIPAATVPADVLSVLADSEISRVQLSCSVPAEIHLRADESLIRQALISVLRNAFEAEGPGSSVVQFRSELSEEKAHVVYTIANPGSLLTPLEEAQVFQPFYTTKSSNLGLGLTLARRIAQIHRGDLKVSSTEGPGFTAFTLTIPVLQDGNTEA